LDCTNLARDFFGIIYKKYQIFLVILFPWMSFILFENVKRTRNLINSNCSSFWKTMSKNNFFLESWKMLYLYPSLFLYSRILIKLILLLKVIKLLSSLLLFTLFDYSFQNRYWNYYHLFFCYPLIFDYSGQNHKGVSKFFFTV